MKRNRNIKKMFKRSLCLSLLLVMMIAILAPTNYVSAGVINKARETEYLIRSQSSLSLYNDVLENVKVGETYTNDYAGAYMDSNGNLIIYVTNLDSIDTYQRICSESAIRNSISNVREKVSRQNIIGSNVPIASNGLIRYETKLHSYNEIFTVHMFLADVLKDFDISCTYISDKDNTLFIATRDDSRRPEILEYIHSNGYSSDFISFEHSDAEPTLTASTVNSGTYFDVEEEANGGSIGFAALYNGVEGYVSAGHVVGKIGNKCIINHYAYSYASYVKNGGYGDFAFIPNPSEFSVRSKVNEGGTIISLTSTASPSQGTVVKWAGAVNNCAGTTVTSTSFNHYSEKSQKTYYDCFKFGTAPDLGNSGGPIYLGNTLVGIVHGNDDGISGLGCKYSHIRDAGIVFRSGNL